MAAYLLTRVALRLGMPAVHVSRHGRPRGCWSGAGSPGPGRGGGEGDCRGGCLITRWFAGGRATALHGDI